MRHAALLWLLLGALRAQVTSYPIHAELDGANRQALSVQVVCPSASNRGSGLGFARVELENVSPQALKLRVSTHRNYGDGFEAIHRETLLRGATARVWLPVMGDAPRLRVELDGGQVNHRNIGSGGALHGVFALLVGASGADAADWKAVLETELSPTSGGTPPRGRGRSPSVTPTPPAPARGGGQLPAILPDDLPPDPRWLSGYDLILVDAAVPGLSAEIQERLARYVAGGGALLVYRSETLGPGPLATMAGAPGAGRHGLGSWLRIQGLSDGAAEQKLRPWLWHPTVGPAIAAAAPYGLSARAGLHVVLRIPGLGDVPVWAFLLLIIAFVCFVARQMVGVLRRRLRPTRLLLALPITGVSFALLILGYGLFSEGFSIRGTMWSLTHLDQKEHVAAGVATRTLYAGLSPSALNPSADTLLLRSASEIHGRARDGELRMDLDRGGRIDGAILPSRTATGLITATVGRARERLRFRRRSDGGLDLLAGPELRPKEQAGKLVLRDFAGQCYTLAATGQLVPVAAPGVEALAAACNSLSGMEHLDGGGWSGTSAPSDWLRGQIDEALAPGTYLAWVEAPPAFDTLGLDVDYQGSVHLVLGRLAPEDILD